MVHIRRMIMIWLALLLSAVVAACGPQETAQPLDPGTPTPVLLLNLEGTEWVLASLNGNSPVEGATVTLAFYEGDYLEGNAGCNSYGVDYVASGYEFRVPQIHRTEMDCDLPQSVMQQEAVYFEALSNVATYRATEDRLTFEDAAGETILAYARKLPPTVDPGLRDTEWLLTSLQGSSLLDGSRITLNLGEEGFGGYAGCNNYGGEYEEASAGILATSEIWSTEMDCGQPGVMEQEELYLATLQDAAAYRLADGRLEIANASGETTLEFAVKEELGTDPGDLVGTVWRLVSLDGDSPLEGTTITLAFHNAYRLSGHLGCREVVATYQATGDNLHLIFEAMVDAGCPMEDELLEQEGRFLGIFAPKADVRLGEGQLEIYGERGGVLVFESLPEDTRPSLEATHWTLAAFIEERLAEGMPEPLVMPMEPLPGTEITLTLEDGTASGSAGCNLYGASYALEGFSLAFQEITFTERACLDPEGVMEQEARYLDWLGGVTIYRVYGNQLWLETGDGRALVYTADEPPSNG